MSAKSNAPSKDVKTAAVIDDYVKVEPKSNDAKTSASGSAGAISSQMKAVLSTVKFGQYKKKAFRIKLYESISFNTNGAGLITGTVPLDPSTITEFSSVAQLFDEFRVVSGVYKFGVLAAMVNGGTNLQSFIVVAYDPTDGTALTSLVAGCQLETHLLVRKPIFSGGAAILNPADKLHSLRVKVPSGVLTGVGTPVTVGASAWQPTAGTPQPYGWFKAYGDNLGATATGFSGVMVFDVEFRMRA